MTLCVSRLTIHEWLRHYVRLCIFFFSSRRRHTRFDCDWSSDVCSSDLNKGNYRISGFSVTYDVGGGFLLTENVTAQLNAGQTGMILLSNAFTSPATAGYIRSEERRVGKECRYRS